MKIVKDNLSIKVKYCNSFFSRLIGFMFKRNIDYCLCFPKCNSIHTFFMLKKIDVIMTDKDYNPAITVSSFDISEPYTDNYLNKSVKVKGSNITVSYDRTTKEEGYEIIMVPTAYSSEWKLVEGNVKEIISVDGGFIGLIVPKNIDSNKIVIKFVPMGYKIGLTISLSTLMLYVMALMTFIIIKRKRGGKRNEETNNSSSSI